MPDIRTTGVVFIGTGMEPNHEEAARFPLRGNAHAARPLMEIAACTSPVRVEPVLFTEDVRHGQVR